jgi:hypothetical protein
VLNKTALISLGLGLVVASVLVGLILVKQRGATPHLAGEVLSVRTLGMDQSSSVAIVDFRFTNDSRFPLVVATTDMSLVTATGETKQGQILAASNIEELFDLFPALGARSTEPLIIKTRFAPGAGRAAMLAARFEIPKADLDARKKLSLFVTDVDGGVSEISK